MNALQSGASAAHLPHEAECPVIARDADITLVKGHAELAPYLDDIADLAGHAGDSNPLFEGPALTAALKQLQGDNVSVALVWERDSGKRRLIGLFPFEARRFYLGLPIRIWTIWLHIHSFLATPLLRKAYETEAIRRFLDYADQAGAPLMRFPLFQADGAFDAGLRTVLAERKFPTVEIGAHRRAFLQSELDGEAYLALHMRKKKRKEYNRLWNRLSDEGEARFLVDEESDVGSWLDEFLRLEQSGWKGKRGTALAERENERAFFEAMCRAAQNNGKLHRLAITLDGKPIAMLASFISGRGAFSFKIAYNETYARYSPGALLIMKAIGILLADPRIDWVDSCAIPDHPMIDHIWAERRAIREVNAGTAHLLSPLLIAYSTHAATLFDRGWSFARSVYYRIRKEVEREQAD